MTMLRLNLDTMEAINFFWASLKDKERVSEQYLDDVASLEGYKLIYEEEFGPESVRRAMSALSNHEPFRAESKKEGRLYTNHLWMMDDLGVAEEMLKTIKLLNLDQLQESLQGQLRYQEINIYVVPFHIDAYVVRDNFLVLNFFKVMVDLISGNETTFEGLPISEAIGLILKENFA